jgi:RimJ/RimL family protein N-acetyltransferase
MSLLRSYHIQTERVTLRCYLPSDAPAMSETILRNHAHLIPFMHWAVKDQHTVEFCTALIRTFSGNYHLGIDYPMAVLDVRDGRYIGGTGLHTRVGKGAYEIGYWIDERYGRQGFTTHVAAALTKVAFEFEAIHRMNIHMQVPNDVSQRIAERLGYKRDALLRGMYPLPDGQFGDIYYYTMLREDYDATDLKSMPMRVFGFDGAELTPTVVGQ